MLVEFMLGAFFIGGLLFLALIAHELNIQEIAHLHEQRYKEYHEADAEIMAIVRPTNPNEGASTTSYTPAIPSQTIDTPEDAEECQLDCTYLYAEEANHNSVPSIYHLDAFFGPLGDNISIYYKNLDTGFVYTYNHESVFFGASLNKAKQALYIHIAAERGYIDMHAVHTFRAEDWWGGTGIIRFMPAGATLTTRELLRHAIVYSDNVAHRMLARYMARIGFSYRDFVAELGANPDFIRSTYSHDTSAADTALWFYALHNYFESESRYNHYLRYDMLNTAFYSHPYFTRGNRFGGDNPVNVQLMHSSYQMAQKYGWAVESFNVAGIVYANSPFMLVIISDMDHGAHGLFEEISWLMHEFNGRYFK